MPLTRLLRMRFDMPLTRLLRMGFDTRLTRLLRIRKKRASFDTRLLTQPLLGMRSRGSHPRLHPPHPE